MDSIAQRRLIVERVRVLMVLTRTISKLTIRARCFYDRPDLHDGLRDANEAIHRIAGHLSALIDPEEKLTPSRADGVAEALELLSPAALDRVYGVMTYARRPISSGENR